MRVNEKTECDAESYLRGSETERCKIDGESHVDDDDERLFLFPHLNNNPLRTRKLLKIPSFFIFAKNYSFLILFKMDQMDPFFRKLVPVVYYVPAGHYQDTG